MGGAKAHYDGIVAFSQTDFTEDLKKNHCAGAGDARR
jgi:non-heme chloroperoxidase